jgi:hypothetical protein
MTNNSPDNNNLLNFIAATVESLRDQMNAMRSEMATKSDLAEMATRKDLERVEARLEARIVAEATAIRGDIEQLQLRLDSIERALSARMGQIETEVSRLRSVVYLLVKDRPDMLRLLLGQTPPASDEERL